MIKKASTVQASCFGEMYHGPLLPFFVDMIFAKQQTTLFN